MALVWHELKPQDSYIVKRPHAFSMHHQRVLAQLYQPLIGSIAFSLYITLLHEEDHEQRVSEERNHQWLMNITNQKMDELYQARHRLEAIGLLKSYEVKRDSEHKKIEYHLLLPLEADVFFHDDLLSICLFNQIGAQRYKQLRSRFQRQFNSDSTEEKLEVTKEFHQVFRSVSQAELSFSDSEESEYSAAVQKLEIVPESFSANKPSFSSFELDLNQMKAYLMKGLNLKKLLSAKNLELFKQLAFFYRLDEWSLCRLIQESLTGDETLDTLLLRQNAKNWYRLQHNGNPPRVVQLRQPLHKQVFTQKEPQTDEEKHLAKLEQISPIQLLEAYQGGGKIAQADINLVEELLIDYGLLPSVVNVLIEYIYFTNEYKLPKNLVTKVAAHWKRIKVDNAVAALDLAKREHAQYKEWQSKQSGGKAKAPAARQNQKIKRDKLPEWITAASSNQEEQQANGKVMRNEDSQSQSQDEMNDESKRKRMRELLQALGEWKEDE